MRWVTCQTAWPLTLSPTAAAAATTAVAAAHDMGDMSDCLAADIVSYCCCCCLTGVFGSSGLNCETRVNIFLHY